MNKTFLAILLASFFILSSSCQTEQNDNDLENWELIGPVKTSENRTYFPRKGIEEIDLNNLNLEESFRNDGKEQLFFNKNGILKEQNYFNKEYLSMQYIQFFDDHGKITKNISYKKGKEIKYYTDFFYDQNGNLIQELTFKKDSTVYVRRTNTYNKLNQKTESLWLYSNYSLKKVKKTFQYDKKGREVERTIYFNDEQVNRIVNTYDDNANLSIIEDYELDGTITKKVVFEYQGKVLLQKNTNNYAKDSKQHIQYNAEGFPFQNKVWEQKKGIEKLTVNEYQYIYDDYGNWVRRVKYANDDLADIILREIAYH